MLDQQHHLVLCRSEEQDRCNRVQPAHSANERAWLRVSATSF